jgi:hypothetical protein
VDLRFDPELGRNGHDLVEVVLAKLRSATAWKNRSRPRGVMTVRAARAGSDFWKVWA